MGLYAPLHRQIYLRSPALLFVPQILTLQAVIMGAEGETWQGRPSGDLS
jgi:hypothetical protein